MEIKITIKQQGKKNPLIREQSLELDHPAPNISLNQFLSKVVTQQVQIYQAKKAVPDSEDTLHPPHTDYLQLLTDNGKAGFGNIYNDKIVNLEVAIQSTLLAFEDGLFAVFQGDEQLESTDQIIDLNLNLPFTFIRLTFLAGSYW